MDTLYQKLNKKLDTLTQHTQTVHDNMRNTLTQPRLINLTNTKFTKEQISTLALGPNYALEKDPKHYINELIIDTENAIGQLDPKVHNTFQYMATTKIKQIMASSTHHTLYRRHQYNLNQIRKTLQRNNLTIARADKNRAIVIINKNSLEQKIKAFTQENGITHLNKDSTDFYQKQIQQALQKCDALIEKGKHKYLMNIRPTASNLNAYIKTHKEDQPIRPVINNMQVPSYKAAKFLTKKLRNLICLPNTYTIKNSLELAKELNNIQINENNRVITLDMKDLYVNLPTKNILHITEFWLNKNNQD